MTRPANTNARWYERVRIIRLPEAEVPVRVKLWTPPWTFASTARRLRALETYHQLAETMASFHHESSEFRRARAQLDAQVSLDALTAAERNTTVIATATWALVFATLGLVGATVALILS